jgi:hypothetical protein
MIGLQVADICANICYRFYRDDRKDIEYKRLADERERAVNAEDSRGAP